MKKNCCKGSIKGFTLLEMLVVVLIIGILASIAIPGYQTAVDKARYVKMMDAVEALSQAEEAYYLQYREYTVSVQDLDIKLNYPLRAAATTADSAGNEYSTVRGYNFPGGGYVDISHADNYDWVEDEAGNKTFHQRKERYVWATGHPKGVSYFRFLNHRKKRPGTRWCAAAADNERMNKLCLSMGGVRDTDSGYEGTTGNPVATGTHWYLLP